MVGLVFIVGVYPLTIVWPSGWAWHTGQIGHLYGDVAALLIVAAALAFLMPRSGGAAPEVSTV
ncbi:MAG: DUF6632 domain-containing protein [Steroidobacteraceae bacterium]